MQVPRLKVFRTLATLSLAFSVAASGLTAQQGTATVTGVVTDAATQEPIAGAQVVVAGTNLSALSNSEGRYLILNVPVGARDIRVQVLGYAPSTQSLTLVAGSSVVGNFSLAQSAIALEGLSVNVITGEAQRARELGTNSAFLQVATDIVPASVTSLSDIRSSCRMWVAPWERRSGFGSVERTASRCRMSRWSTSMVFG